MDTDILVLRRKEISKLLSLEECIAAMRNAFVMHAEGKALAPALLHVDAERGEFHIKGGGLRMDRAYFALKANGGFFGNLRRWGIPNIIGLIVLYDAENGRPLAIMDSTAITLLRTGATTAAAAAQLARLDSTTATICGCGNQGRIQLESIMQTLPGLERVFAWDHKPANAERFAAEMAEKTGLSVQVAAELSAAALASDVIITATPARSFFLRESMIRAGTFIAAVGADSPAKQELEPRLVANAKLVVDILAQCAEVGELHHALDAGLMTRDDAHAELGDILAGKASGLEDAEEIIVFDATGSAIQDTAAAAAVYERALAGGIGSSISIYT